MRHNIKHPLVSWLVICGLLTFYFATRVHHLTQLPLHNDEGLHLTRAVAVWDGHPFWDISDGKIINHWPIALFYPQNAPDFAARYPTVLTSVLGLSAGYALLRRLQGDPAAQFGVWLWVVSPYLFFYERLAQSDAQAGALVVVAVWASVLFARTGRTRYALLTGFWFALALMFKFTAAPFAVVIGGLYLMLGKLPLRRRLIGLLYAAFVGILLVSPPMLYLLAKQMPLFHIAMGWIGSGGGDSAAWANLRRFVGQLLHFGVGGAVNLIVLLLGWLAWLRFSSRDARLLFVLLLLPLTLIIGLSTMTFPRHFIATLPLLLLLGGAGWSQIVQRRPLRLGLMLLLIGLQMPFAWAAYVDPPQMRLSALTRREFIQDHGSGYGLQEAMRALPVIVGDDDVPLVGSMFPSSCRRANFYAVDGLTLQCTDAPGTDLINALLTEHAMIYVLADGLPGIGFASASAFPMYAEQVQAYPRPDETPDSPSIVLYRVFADAPDS